MATTANTVEHSDTSAIKPVILAIDDESEIVEILRATLEESGMRVVGTDSAREGLRIYEERWREIDVVLLDYLMPEMNGDLAFEAIMRVNPYAKVIMLTGDDTKVAQRLQDTGLREVLSKPFYLDELVALVRETLDAP
jgi:DNA-binding NtrC family response regulator